jgi:hypothetical protein
LGNNFVQVEPFLKESKRKLSKVILLPDYEILPVLLTAKAGGASFQKYAPKDAPTATKKALRKWFDKKEWRKFKVDKPPDFR